MQGGILAADAVKIADIRLDVAGLVPVSHFDFVFFRVQIFFPARDRLVLQKLKTVVDAVGGGERGGERDAGFEHPGLPGLQVERQNIGCVDEEVRTIEIALRVRCQFDQVLFQLPLVCAPGEVSVGLGEAELGKALHQFRSGKGFGKKDRVRMANLDFVDQPFPEAKWLGVRIVDPEYLDALIDPEQHDIAQRVPQRAGIFG